MFGYLKGKIIFKHNNVILLDVNDVGYQIFVPADLFANLALNATQSLYIHTNVKEDEIALYGFDTFPKLNLFKKLISISGIGPKMALDILSSPTYILQNALLQNDPVLLTEIKGIGKKTAERILVELKNKINPEELAIYGQKMQNISKLDEDVLAALEGLGYDKGLIFKKLQNLPEGLETAEAKIKWFLQNL